MNVYDELCILIDSELNWCKKNRNPHTTKFEGGFIKGLEQARYFIVKAKEIAEDENEHNISEELEELRMPHNYCQDEYYSCPKAGSEVVTWLTNDDACDCGADEHNSRLDKIIKRLNRNSNG